jgi:Cof subfamily protein (haloacid dehalogenase superfamily)
MHHSARDFVDRLGLGNEPVISYNGAMVRHAHEEELILHDPVPTDLAKEILEYCIANYANIHYYVDDVMYVLRVDHWARSYLERTRSVPVPVGDVRRLPGAEPTKILIIDKAERAERFLREGRERFGDRVYVTHSLPEYVEFLNPTASKGRALRALAQHLEIPLRETMACGDMINDQPMVEAAGIGVAMAHSPDEVRGAADYVTGEGDEGVAEAIEKFVLDDA